MEKILQTPVPQDMTALLFMIVVVLSGVIVTLALYIRRLHNKNTDRILKLSEDIIKVTSNSNNSTDNNTAVIKSLHELIIRSTIFK